MYVAEDDRDIEKGHRNETYALWEDRYALSDVHTLERGQNNLWE